MFVLQIICSPFGVFGVVLCEYARTRFTIFVSFGVIYFGFSMFYWNSINFICFNMAISFFSLGFLQHHKFRLLCHGWFIVLYVCLFFCFVFIGFLYWKRIYIFSSMFNWKSRKCLIYCIFVYDTLIYYTHSRAHLMSLSAKNNYCSLIKAKLNAGVECELYLLIIFEWKVGVAVNHSNLCFVKQRH